MFSTVKSLYVFFSSSVRLWDVLKKYLPNLSLKPLSDTRCESSIDDLTLPRFQIGDIYDAMVQISEKFNGMTAHETTSLVNQFTYEGRDETIDDPTKRNKIEFYYYLLDIVTNKLKAHCDYFDFLYDIAELKNAPPDNLDTKCRNLTEILQDDESSDIDALELRDELKVLSTLLKPGIGPKEILKFMGRRNFCPNVNIRLRIPLTLSVTAASGKRSFSKLKLIKTYLRSTMNKIHLNDLATILIENELAEDLHYTDHVKEFAQAKDRKVRFV
ncbi:uncharacterized protein LOC126249187 [Schistocerca nitens]|uniref:uncharacterized protein LOC126249187 n=1 Tax=Schistocerca nitens TaxID=7011 RepID=UPI0021179B72|nr:uncharacterized protein LOC126249187 [Schistocerca nitens]